MNRDEFFAMLTAAMEAGHISDIHCGMHDGLPMTEEENADLEEGFDPCVPVVRIWEEGR